MPADPSRLSEAASVGAATLAHDPVQWRCRWRVAKYHPGDYKAGAAPFEVIDREGNLLVYGGASALWECLIGNGTATAGAALTFFNNANAHIGVGDSTTAAAATDTNLVAATNVLRKAMDTGYPTHTDATTAGAQDISFRSVFAGTEANFAWNEWGLFNAATGGRMLNRKVEALGTKASGSTWTFTVTLSLT
jgi:hypothetical protein